ncbi:helix-turn-helix domain-containing protein [Microbacterium jejuense]|uniref:Helix-turn-helix domain-containing protein n=1 Tax=Microbacterium jejuense TaxID=1263637 RepID=A0ABS7HR72_9MICO|nr:helix-turn-helix domain-containing protein [Microbacterium jejuense]MBW9095461.1 helix-turn-helix domain-containing protein [Microbacterium jejuense]
MTDGRAAPTLTARQPKAVHSALTVLEAVARLGAGASARDISRELGLPRATTYRLLNLLVQDEYLVRTPDLAGFALGAKVVQLASVAAPPARLTSAARGVLADTRASLRGGVHVVFFVNGRLTVVDADPDFPLSDAVRLVREPDRFAIGRLLLVERGVADPGAVRDFEEIGATRQLGELAPGYGCVAVPILDGAGGFAGALGFSGSRRRAEDPTEVLTVLKPAAARLGPLVV